MSELMPVGTIEARATDVPATLPGLVLEYARQAEQLAPIILNPGRYHLGSAEECEIQVPATGVAARHCLLVVGPRKTVLKAFSPLTWINECPTREGTLQPGDRFVIGPVEFAVRSPRPDEAAPWTDGPEHAGAPVSHPVRPVYEPLGSPARPADAARAPAGHSAEWTALAESRAALHEQRDYLARLASTLEGRDRDLQARETELQARWDELEARRTERQEWERDMQRQQDELSCARSDLDEERRRLASLQDQLESDRQELERRGRAVDERQSDLDRRDEDLRESSDRLHSERSELDDRRRQLQTEQAQLQQQSDALAAREAELAGRQSQLDAAREQLAREQAEFTQQQADWRLEADQIAAARAALDDSRRDFQSECQRIDAARAELVQLRSDLEVSRADSGLVRRALESEREQLEAVRHGIDAERAALEARIRDWEAQQADLRQRALDTEQLAAERQRLDEQQAALQQQSAGLEDERRTLDELRNGLDAQREELQAARARWEAQQAEWTADARQLDAERARLALEREQLQAQREQLAARPSVHEDVSESPEPDAVAPATPEPILWEDLSDSAPEEPVAPEPALFAFCESRPVAESHPADDSPEFGDDSPVFGDDSNEHHDPLALAADWTVPATPVEPAPDARPEHAVDPAAEWPAEATPAAEPLPDFDPLAGHADLPAFAHDAIAEQDAAFLSEPPSAFAEAEHIVGGDADQQEEAGVAPAVQALRSQLAELFGISSQTALGHSRLEPEEPEEDLAPLEPVVGDSDEEQLVSELTEEPPGDDGLTQDEEPVAESAASSIDAEDAPAPQPSAPAEAHGDSIAAYMERLLARSRTSTPKSESPPTEPARRRRPAAETEEPAAAAPPVPPPPPLEMPAAPPKSIAPEEKVALRANIDSFRELANASARSAVAKHESKKLRTMVQIKVALAIIAGGLTVVLFVANSIGRISYGVYTLAAAFATVVMAFDLARTVLAFYRWKSVESAAAWDGEPELSSENLRADTAGNGADDDNTTSDLPLTPATEAEPVAVVDESEEPPEA